VGAPRRGKYYSANLSNDITIAARSLYPLVCLQKRGTPGNAGRDRRRGISDQRDLKAARQIALTTALSEPSTAGSNEKTKDGDHSNEKTKGDRNALKESRKSRTERESVERLLNELRRESRYTNDDEDDDESSGGSKRFKLAANRRKFDQWGQVLRTPDLESSLGPLIEPTPATPGNAGQQNKEIVGTMSTRSILEVVSAPKFTPQPLQAHPTESDSDEDDPPLANGDTVSLSSTISTHTQSLATAPPPQTPQMEERRRESICGTPQAMHMSAVTSLRSVAITPKGGKELRRSARALPSEVASLSALSTRRKQLKAQKFSKNLTKARREHDDAIDDARSSAKSQESPRSTVVQRCLSEGVRPTAGLALRRLRTTELNLAHQAIGDAAGNALAAGLAAGAPAVRLLNVRGNRLGDEALAALVRAATHKRELRSFDISENVLGPHASKLLGAFLGDASCPIASLELEHSDVDDDECAALVGKVQRNRHSALRSINLARNLIGAGESRNVVQPNYVTGGEAIAEWLQSRACAVRSLDLSWNMVRGDSAVQLGDALKTNTSLERLSLKANGLGTDGGAAVARALFLNNTLRHLDVSHNRIMPSAAYVFAISLLSGAKALEQLNLSFNPIGAPGAKPLLRMPLELSALEDNETIVDVKIDNCDFRMVDNACWFDSARPAGAHQLLLSKPYDYAVGVELMHLAATTPAAAITKLTLKDVPYGARAAGNVNLIRVNPDEERRKREEANRAALRAVSAKQGSSGESKTRSGKAIIPRTKPAGNEPTIADDGFNTSSRRLTMDAEAKRRVFERVFSSPKAINQLFRTMDLDQSGSIELNELEAAMHVLGVDDDDDSDELERLFARYDLDESGRLEAAEFMDLIESRRAALERETMPSRPFLADADESPPRAVFELPAGGRASVIYDALVTEDMGPSTDSELTWHEKVERAQAAKAHNTTNPRGVKRLLKMISAQEGGADKGAMLLMALPYMRLRADEALELHSTLVHELGDTTLVLAAELPQMATPLDARMLVGAYAPMPTQKRLLRNKLGPEYPLIMGQFTGRFQLNLKDPIHQRALERILLINDNEKVLQTASGFCDPSEHGPVDAEGGECFRHATFDGTPVIISTRLFEEAGPNGEPPFSKESGRICFDYASPIKPGPNARVMSRAKFMATCKLLDIKAAKSVQERVLEAEKRRIKALKAEKKRGFTRPRDTKMNATIIGSSISAQPVPGSLELTSIGDGTSGLSSPPGSRPSSPIGSRPTSAIGSRPTSATTERPSSPVSSRPESASDMGSRPSSAQPNATTTGPKSNASVALSLTLAGSSQEIFDVFTVGDSCWCPSKIPLMPNVGRVPSKSRLAKAECKEAEEALKYSQRSSLQSEFDKNGRNLLEIEATAVQGNAKLRGAIIRVKSEKSISSHLSFKAKAKPQSDVSALATLAGGGDGDGDKAPERKLLNVPAPQQRRRTTNLMVARQEKKNVEKKDPERDEAQAMATKLKDPTSKTAKVLRRMCNLMCMAASIRKKAATRIEAYSVLTTVLDEVCMHWFSAQQARQLLAWYPLPELPPSVELDFNPIADIACALHQQIVDPWNFDITMMAMNSDERSETVSRVGWLNVFSPLKPEGAYSLDLSKREDRQIVKVLIHLEAAESARKVKGWADAMFQYAREVEPVIGWEMPKSWLSKSGLPKSGVLTVHYSSEVNLEKKKVIAPPIQDDGGGIGGGKSSAGKPRKKRTIDNKTATKLQKKMQDALRGRSPGDLFMAYDETGDGMLDGIELLKLIRKDLQIPTGEIRDEEVGALVKNLDDDGSGTLSIHELVDFVERGVATFNSGLLKIDEKIAEKICAALKAAVTYHLIIKAFDESGDGLLDAKEVKQLIRVGLDVRPEEASDEDIENLVYALDDNDSGNIDLEEMADFVEHGKETFTLGRRDRMDEDVADKVQAALQEAMTYGRLFGKFDKSGDGSLDSKELRDCIRMDFKIPTNQVADNDIDLLVRALDDDGSGALSITELVDFVEHVRVLMLKNTFGPTA
jgi:Ca2+-binding EF-hand superfamily protein/Ran GTPase-activating protein (RanGAP) involved in mRNA processing and transport